MPATDTDAQQRTENVGVRFTPGERRDIELVAEVNGATLSSIIRKMALSDIRETARRIRAAGSKS